MPDYDAYMNLPKNNKYGGTAILVKRTLGNVNIREDLNLTENCGCDKCHTENIWLEISIGHCKYIVGALYNHPNGNTTHFTEKLDSTLGNVPPDASCLILGDMNIDLMKLDHTTSFEYFTMMSSHNFQPCITIPTRITDTSATLIDHIFLKLPPKHMKANILAGNIFCDISDHLPNFITINHTPREDKTKRQYIRLYSEKNISKFRESLENMNWPSYLDVENTEEAYTKFYTHLYHAFEAHFPLVPLSRKRSKDKKWITLDLKNSIKRKKHPK